MLCVLGLFLLFVQGNNVQRTYLNNNFPLTNSLNVYNYLTLKKMNISTICQALIVSMLSVSYPILSQVVARLDDRYSSLIIVDLILLHCHLKISNQHFNLTFKMHFIPPFQPFIATDVFCRA